MWVKGGWRVPVYSLVRWHDLGRALCGLPVCVLQSETMGLGVSRKLGVSGIAHSLRATGDTSWRSKALKVLKRASHIHAVSSMVTVAVQQSFV